MVATSGDRLVEDRAVGAIRSLMVPGARLVTPNSQEAEILTGKAVDTIDGQRRAAEALLGARGKRRACERWTCRRRPESQMFCKPRRASGCMRASGWRRRQRMAQAAHLLQRSQQELSLGASLPRAAEKARAYVHGAIENAPGLGGGHGPLDHGWMMARRALAELIDSRESIVLPGMPAAFKGFA